MVDKIVDSRSRYHLVVTDFEPRENWFWICWKHRGIHNFNAITPKMCLVAQYIFWSNVVRAMTWQQSWIKYWSCTSFRSIKEGSFETWDSKLKIYIHQSNLEYENLYPSDSQTVLCNLKEHLYNGMILPTNKCYLK